MYLELIGIEYNLLGSLLDMDIDLDRALVTEVAAELEVVQ